MINYGKPKRVLGLVEREKVVELSKIMEDKFQESIKKEISKMSRGGKNEIKPG